MKAEADGLGQSEAPGTSLRKKTMAASFQLPLLNWPMDSPHNGMRNGACTEGGRGAAAWGEWEGLGSLEGEGGAWKLGERGRGLATWREGTGLAACGKGEGASLAAAGCHKGTKDPYLYSSCTTALVPPAHMHAPHQAAWRCTWGCMQTLLLTPP